MRLNEIFVAFRCIFRTPSIRMLSPERALDGQQLLVVEGSGWRGRRESDFGVLPPKSGAPVRDHGQTSSCNTPSEPTPPPLLPPSLPLPPATPAHLAACSRALLPLAFLSAGVRGLVKLVRNCHWLDISRAQSDRLS